MERIPVLSVKIEPTFLARVKEKAKFVQNIYK
jgi:hypothetical protein